MSRNAFVMKYFSNYQHLYHLFRIAIGWNRNSFSLTCHVFNSNNKREKIKRIIIIFMVFFQLFISHFQFVLWHLPLVISVVPSWPQFQAPFMRKNLQKCSKNASERCRLGSHSEFSHESRFWLLKWQLLFRGVWRMPKQKVTSKDVLSNSPGFEMLCHWRREAVRSGAGCDIAPMKPPHAPEEAADCCTINYVSTKRIGSNLNRTEIVSNHKPIICYVFELLDKRLIGCFMIRESHCFCLFID